MSARVIPFNPAQRTTAASLEAFAVICGLDVPEEARPYFIDWLRLVVMDQATARRIADALGVTEAPQGVDSWRAWLHADLMGEDTTEAVWALQNAGALTCAMQALSACRRFDGAVTASDVLAKVA